MPRDRVPPSFGPLLEGLRICFETPVEGQEPRGSRALGAHHIAKQNYFVQRSIAIVMDVVNSRLVPRSQRDFIGTHAENGLASSRWIFGNVNLGGPANDGHAATGRLLAASLREARQRAKFC